VKPLLIPSKCFPREPYLISIKKPRISLKTSKNPSKSKYNSQKSNKKGREELNPRI
jgi:hypothetical protein